MCILRCTESSQAYLGIWRTEQAPQDLKQDILLPIPEKGDASLCSNYRTIALQSIAGKAYANVLSARLSEWLADNLLDEQCSFRPNRSIIDALFSLRLLCSGAWDKGKTYSAIIRSEVDSSPVHTSVGFKQGCVLAPPLFNICLDTVIRQLLPELRQLGVTICYITDGQLRHCKNPTEEELMWILLYADDISLVCDTAKKLREAVIVMDATFL